MTHLIALTVGLTAGTHIATWGMFKDSIHEGFTYRQYFRSIALAGFLAVGIAHAAALDLARVQNLLLLFGMTYAAERAAMEFYKGFLREEDQEKYFIPMQLHFFGRIVHRRRTRWAVGAGLAAFVSVLVVGIGSLPPLAPGISGGVVAFAAGAVGGLVVASGGAWKDGPFEGFEWRKFFRSPLVAGTYAALLLPVSDRPLYLALAGVGLSVATLETYKTFLFPSKPRGKFTGKPIRYPGMLVKRLRFVPLYFAIWIGVLAAFASTYGWRGFPPG